MCQILIIPLADPLQGRLLAERQEEGPPWSEHHDLLLFYSASPSTLLIFYTFDILQPGRQFTLDLLQKQLPSTFHILLGT